MEDSKQTILRDSFGRRVDYLRLSVTSRCNLRCIYCNPSGNCFSNNSQKDPDFELLSDILRISKDLGFRKVRFTGGEPLLRKDLPCLIEVAKKSGFSDITLTTNGILLSKRAKELRDAGIDRINLSLDTIFPIKYRMITSSDSLDKVLNGLFVARSLGIRLKLNVVLLSIIPIDSYIKMIHIFDGVVDQIRFIEIMRTFLPERYSMIKRSCKDLIERLKLEYNAVEIGHFGTAITFKVPGMDIKVGFIPEKNPQKCLNCNKIRFSADLHIYPCLYSKRGVSFEDGIKSAILCAINRKPKMGNYYVRNKKDFNDNVIRGLISIGG